MTSLAVILVLGAVPAGAAAKPGCGAGQSVPADSEIDQYAQSIPGACGNQQNETGFGGSGGGVGGGGGSGDAGSSAIPPSTVQRLYDLGANGAGTQALADANAPQIRGDGGDRGQGSKGGGGSDSGAGSVLDSLLGGDEGDGMGLVLPLILLAITAGGIAYVTRRRMSQAG